MRAFPSAKLTSSIRAGIAAERISEVTARIEVEIQVLEEIRNAEHCRRLGCWILGRRGSSFLSCLHDGALAAFAALSRAEVATPNLPPEGPQGVRFTFALLWRTHEIPGCIF